MNDPENWRWVWLAAALTFSLGEMASPGSFFLAPFGVGAAAAALAAFLGAPIGIGWLAFVIVSAAAFAALRPLARRLDADHANPLGVGAGRLVGDRGVVLEAVPNGPDALGLVRVGREEWRAQSADGHAIPEGQMITVSEVRGTRLVVSALGSRTPTHPPTAPPERST